MNEMKATLQCAIRWIDLVAITQCYVPAKTNMSTLYTFKCVVVESYYVQHGVGLVDNRFISAGDSPLARPV